VRMRSDLPKVLHPLLGKTLVSYVVEACRKAKIDRTILVVGHRADLVKQAIGTTVEYVEQREQLGTGHALMMAANILKEVEGDLLTLVGDTPFLTGSILRKLIRHHHRTGAAATVMTTIIDPPPAYGRIIRDAEGKILRIVEERDATPEENRIVEVNSSHYCFRAEKVLPLLQRIKTNNDQGEYYLTDAIQLLAEKGERVETLTEKDPSVLIGINSRLELTNASQHLQQRILERLMDHGTTILDTSSVYIEPDVKIGKDSVIHPYCSIMGKTKIGARCVIGPQAKLKEAVIGDDCTVEFSVVERRKIENGATVGPFAYISGE
jgi:bifunctional UDP-N-acetylglucosamine pyrophosphorylase/glucosamine-1-phosphate N-acetyltransferase